MGFDLAVFIQVVTALGSLAAFIGLLRVRADNAKTKAETASIESEIGERVFTRMERINTQLESRVAALEERLAEQEALLEKQASTISLLQEKERELALKNAKLRILVTAWQQGIEMLIKQLTENGLDPVWKPPVDPLLGGEA